MDDGPRIVIDVVRALDAEHLEPTALTVREPTLDDVFLTLTGHAAEADIHPERRAGHDQSAARCGMTAIAAVERVPSVVRMHPFRRAVVDTKTITWRNLITLMRLPQVLVFSTIQPIIFVLMFRYVFGGAIKIPGIDYVDYLMPGVFAQTVVFGSISTGIGLAEDLQ